MAIGLGANVTVLDKSLKPLTYLDDVFGPRMQTLYATLDAIEEQVLTSDLVIGAILVPGAAAPKLIHKSQLSRMKKGSVLVDVPIDQGGCFETSKPTTHSEPTYEVDGVVHYCVANMPGAVARTSTFALQLAKKGWKRACADDPNLLAGLNIHVGKVTCEAVAKDLGYAFHNPKNLV